MPLFVVPDSFGSELREFNGCHNPSGAGGGQFCTRPVIRASITSFGGDQPRADKTSKATFERMREFERRLRAIPTLRHVKVVPAQGQWGGKPEDWEPSWAVSYVGNGAARRLLAEYGEKHDQEAVIIAKTWSSKSGVPRSKADVMTELTFHGAVRRERRDQIGAMLNWLGVKGWTWGKLRGGGAYGKTVLRLFGGDSLRIPRTKHFGNVGVLWRYVADLRPAIRHRDVVIETLGSQATSSVTGYSSVLGTGHATN